MSRLSDYSKFDHLEDGDSITSDSKDIKNLSKNQFKQESINSKPVGVTKKGSIPGRYIFEYNGRKIYDWEQTLDEISIYIDLPPGVTSASQLLCKFYPKKLQIGLKETDQFFIDEDTFSKINVDDSSWYLDKDDRTINIILSKVYKGETWECVLQGNSNAGGSSNIDPITKQEIQKELMIERFQEENPGFDFRGAEFNGQVPDPRTFMGGVKYS